jgi:hypothetical protein
MKVTVKDLKQNSREFEADPNQTVGSFGLIVKDELKFVDDVRLIYCGRILDNNKLMSEYFKDTNNGFIVCMPMKKPAAAQVTPPTTSATSITSTPVSTSVSTPVSSSVSNTNTLPVMQTSNSTQTYTIDQIRAVIMLFTRVLKVSPDLFYMFSTNDKMFQEFMLSPIFTDQLLKLMLDSSANVVSAMQSGQDIAVPIPLFSYTNGRTGTHVTSNPSTTNPSTTNPSTSNPSTSNPSTSNTTNPTTTDDDNDNNDNNDDNDNDESYHNTDNLFLTNLPTQSFSTTLTDEDRHNIQELCQLGFTEDMVTQTYLMTNKNKELTASMLFEFAG